jgi:hypothetical protein
MSQPKVVIIGGGLATAQKEVPMKPRSRDEMRA